MRPSAETRRQVLWRLEEEKFGSSGEQVWRKMVDMPGTR